MYIYIYIYVLNLIYFSFLYQCHYSSSPSLRCVPRISVMRMLNVASIILPIQHAGQFVSASELYRPSDRRLSAKWLPTFADKGCHVVSVIDPYGRILGFLDKSRYFFYQAAPQLYSLG
jgi:hypothetical protein